MVWLRRMYARPLFVVVGILGLVLARFPPIENVPTPLAVLAAPLAMAAAPLTMLAVPLTMLAAPWHHPWLRLYAGAYE